MNLPPFKDMPAKEGVAREEDLLETGRKQSLWKSLCKGEEKIA